MPPLAERLHNPPARNMPGFECSVGFLLRTLPDDESAALAEMLANYSWTANMIYDAVTGENHTVGRQSISRHRKGSCGCAKSRSTFVNAGEK